MQFELREMQFELRETQLQLRETQFQVRETQFQGRDVRDLVGELLHAALGCALRVAPHGERARAPARRVKAKMNWTTGFSQTRAPAVEKGKMKKRKEGKKEKRKINKKNEK